MGQVHRVLSLFWRGHPPRGASKNKDQSPRPSCIYNSKNPNFIDVAFSKQVLIWKKGLDFDIQ